MERTSRKPSNLSESLHRQLNSYALAASAAGVSLLALAQPADAKIVYKAAHIDCSLECEFYFEGTKGFVVHLSGNSNASAWSRSLRVYAGSLNRSAWIVGYRTASPFASALRGGVRVAAATLTRPLMERQFSYTALKTYGPWANGGKGVKNRYLGLKYISNGAHFGWARLNVTYPKKGSVPKAVLTGYAYETVPNKPIITGKTHGKDVITVQPATLGHLARGASAINDWR